MSTDLIERPKKLRRKSTERSPRPIKLTDGDADIIRHVANPDKVFRPRQHPGAQALVLPLRRMKYTTHSH